MKTPPGYWETRARAAAVAIESGEKVTSDLDLRMHAPNIVIDHHVHKSMSIQGITMVILQYSDEAHLEEGIEPPSSPYHFYEIE